MKSNTSIQVSSTLSEHRLLTFQWGLQPHEAQPFVAPVPLEVLAESPGYAEHWNTADDANYEHKDGHQLISTEEHLVMVFQADDVNLHDWVSQVYRRAYQASKAAGYPHLLRTWNYLYDINATDQGLERYQTFCVARHQVMESLQLLNDPNPAATAIGTHNKENSLVFLFARSAGHVIENKRQTPAWEYPQQYAPRQPRFSRAIIIDDVLFCSGTASVVGHETAHVGNLPAQFDECLNNLQVLIESSGARHRLADGMYRFYVRDKAHLPQVSEKIKNSQIQQYVILHGDVCRENLLIECEVVFQSN
ncbi:chorismate transformation enzyme, FkbO/Hyg5 family [Marinicella sediminis]|uniref:chorismate transformation enzyme, FkbO/Hyg5 family n=1 Tax=Marinicella sediminis TaxID=1792834 RepID=UPI0009855F90|nr:hypothetical protein [Marinicella sediminis]